MTLNEVRHALRGWAGYLLDIGQAMRCSLSHPHSYTKFRIIKKVKERTDSRVFIETGTSLGVTAWRCSFIFSTVYTIELDNHLADRATRFLAKRKNVTVIRGDGLNVLPRLMETAEIRETLVFLDGHFSGGTTACGLMPEPAVEQLKILSAYRAKVNAIVIDDFRCFGTQPGFPKKSVLLKVAEENFGDLGFDIMLLFDQLIIVRRP